MYTITANVWRHPGQGGWHFVSLPPDVADEVRARSLTTPFGAVAARVTVGTVEWETSLFADTGRATYLLPLKADVRRRAGIAAGDAITLTIALAGP